MEENEKRPAPTYAEFKAAVRKEFLEFWQCDIPRATKYFEGEEAEQVITERYKSYLAEYKKNDLTYEQFVIGGVASVAYCLQLMCE